MLLSITGHHIKPMQQCVFDLRHFRPSFDHMLDVHVALGSEKCREAK